MRTTQIAKDYNLKVVNVTQKNIKRVSKKYEIEKTNLRNNAYAIENEDIVLGIYDDKDLKFAAFFHEVGHTLIPESFEKLVNNDEMLIEYQAWIEGLKVAKKYGYLFSNKTFKYILKSINSYYKDALNVYNKRKPTCAKNSQQKLDTDLKNN
jgi:hypothetical protein